MKILVKIGYTVKGVSHKIGAVDQKGVQLASLLDRFQGRSSMGIKIWTTAYTLTMHSFALRLASHQRSCFSWFAWWQTAFSLKLHLRYQIRVIINLLLQEYFQLYLSNQLEDDLERILLSNAFWRAEVVTIISKMKAVRNASPIYSNCNSVIVTVGQSGICSSSSLTLILNIIAIEKGRCIGQYFLFSSESIKITQRHYFKGFALITWVWVRSGEFHLRLLLQLQGIEHS